jgi:hypothetical protein
VFFPFPLKKNFHGEKIFRKYHCLKVENFQLQNIFPTENLCQPITFYKIFFLRKIFQSENGLLIQWFLSRQTCCVSLRFFGFLAVDDLFHYIASIHSAASYFTGTSFNRVEPTSMTRSKINIPGMDAGRSDRP